jgi:hypothetical protein
MNRLDLDFHADCSVAGLESLVFLDWDRTVVVSSYDTAGNPKTLTTVSAALEYDLPESGRTVCLILYQAIYLPTLQHNLLCPMQMRLHGVVVNETPRFQCEIIIESSHSVVVQGVSGDETITIPLFLKGVTSCMTTRKPTKFEFENCDHFELTAESPAYDPHCESYASKEDNMTEANGRLRKDQDNSHPRRRHICSMTQEVSVIKAKYSDTDAKLQNINEALNFLSCQRHCTTNFP